MGDGTTTPAVLLGGSTGPLAIARELSKRGVAVHLSLQKGRPELATRHATKKYPYDNRDTAAAVWSDLLLGEERQLQRAVILPCDDDALEFVVQHHEQLATTHLLGRTQREHLDAFLSKEKTARLAADTGIRLPRVWSIDADLDVDALFAREGTEILLKPIHSHRFQRAFGGGGRKHFVAHDRDQFRHAAARLRDAEVGAIAMEMVPGPDANSVTYYTFRGEGGRPLFEFCKQVLRRFPRNEGPGSLHVASWDAEIGSLCRQLLDAVEFEGYANIEFKRDARDGVPTLIEVNPRFTASQELLVRCGIPAGWLVYQALTGGQPQAPANEQTGLLFWDPARDLRAMREHRSKEGLTAWQCLRSLRGRRVLPLFHWTDPAPSLRRLLQLGSRAFRSHS
tara:strand:- start:115 stop:1299 length:1185 start_codon:yes stop_codon:yes gene_type:complete